MTAGIPLIQEKPAVYDRGIPLIQEKPAVIDRHSQACHEFVDALETFIELLHGGGIGNPDVLGGSERFTRCDGYVSFFEKPGREIDTVADTAAPKRCGYVRICIECPAGLRAFDSRNCAQSFQHKFPPTGIFRKHHTNRFLWTAEGLKRRLL